MYAELLDWHLTRLDRSQPQTDAYIYGLAAATAKLVSGTPDAMQLRGEVWRRIQSGAIELKAPT